MLKIKKLGATLLSIVMSLHIIPDSLLASKQTYATDNMETTKYVLPIQKNGIEALEIEVYEQDEKYYTIPQNIALLTGATYTDGERCPVYGGQSFTFTRGMFEVSVDAENQKMYSCLTEYDYSIRKTLNSKLSLVNSYLNLHDPIYDFTEFDEKITDEMIEQVDLPDEIKDVFLNEPEFSLETYALDNTDISVVEIDSTYMIELIPWLTYMGAECNTTDECLEVNMPHRTLWESIMPDLHGNTHNKVQAEKSTAHNVWDVSCSVFVDVISDIPGFIKNTAIDVYKDVTGQQSDDKYTEEAIYDILKVDYSKSQQINDKVEAINEFVGLANSDVINASASIYEFAYDEYDSYLPYLTNYIPNDKYEELCDRAIKMENLKNNTEALKFVLGCVVTINEKLNYSDDTKQSLNNILGQSIDSYVRDDFDGKWTDTARRIMKDIDSTENIVTGAILKEGIDFLFDKGKDEGLALFGKQNYATLSLDLAKSLLINAPMFRPVWEGYDAQLYMIKQNEIQVDMLELIDSIVKKSINAEKCSNAASLTELADALKFYYRAVIAHANNSVKYLEEVDMFNENQDALIKEYRSLSEKATEYLYNVSNCTVTPIKKYSSLKNDLITEEWVKQFFYKDVIINEVLKNEHLYESAQEMWFQDLDLDGTCELLLTSGLASYGYYFNGEELSKITLLENEYYDMGSLRLYSNSKTKSYGYHSEDSVTNSYFISDITYKNGVLTIRSIVDRMESGIIRYWYNSNGIEISQNEYADLYNAYVKDLVEYSYTIDKIGLSEFKDLSDNQKYERLKKSYESFEVGDEIGAFPLYEFTSEPDWIENYRIVLQKEFEQLGYNSGASFGFLDIDQDEILELIVSTGSTAIDRIHIYTIDTSGQVIQITDGKGCGDYGSYGNLGYNQNTKAFASSIRHSANGVDDADFGYIDAVDIVAFYQMTSKTIIAMIHLAEIYWYDNTIVGYKIDDNVATEEQYDALLNRYCMTFGMDLNWYSMNNLVDIEKGLEQYINSQPVNVMEYCNLNFYKFAEQFDMQIKEGPGGCNAFGTSEYLYRRGEWADFYSISLHTNTEKKMKNGAFQISIISEKYSIYGVNVGMTFSECLSQLEKEGFRLKDSETWGIDDTYYYYAYNDAGDRIQIEIYNDICGGIDYWPIVYSN